MKATKRDFVRVQNALSNLCGYPAFWDVERETWRSPSDWLKNWRGVPHGQVKAAVIELVTWLNLRFPAGAP